MSGYLQGRALHVDRHLSQFAINYTQEEARFIGTRLFPVVNVDKQSDIILTFSQAYFFLR